MFFFMVSTHQLCRKHLNVPLSQAPSNPWIMGTKLYLHCCETSFLWVQLRQTASSLHRCTEVACSSEVHIISTNPEKFAICCCSLFSGRGFTPWFESLLITRFMTCPRQLDHEQFHQDGNPLNVCGVDCLLLEHLEWLLLAAQKVQCESNCGLNRPYTRVLIPSTLLCDCIWR